MDQVGVRELRQHVAALVRRARSGERIVVTVDGHPVAQLGPIEPLTGAPTLADLGARGLVVPARRDDRDDPDLTVDLGAGHRLDHLVRDLR